MNEHIPGTKIAEKLFSRPEGATMAEVVAATGGRQHNLLERLKARGYAVRSRKEGRTTRYWATLPGPPSYDVTVTRKGQVTLPKEVRERLGLDAARKLRFVVEEGRVIVKPAKYGIGDLAGMLGKPRKHLTLKQMDEAIQRAVIEKFKSK
jgi:AbrB family looped-hinge helix DNA binding protein